MSQRKSRFRNQYSVPYGDCESIKGESPVVSGQALTGAELFRRQSSGLPFGCAVRQFNQINPYLEKFSIYDSISQFRIRHGMLISDQISKSEKDPAPASSAPSEAPSDGPGQANQT